MMRKPNFLCFLLLFLSHMAFPSFGANSVCYITNQVAVKPNPSLVQCYKNNPSACCNSLADGLIGDVYDNLLSNSCARTYPWLEAYFCLACSPSEPSVTDHTAKTVNVCKSFMLKLWSADLTSNTLTFDNCGMRTVWETDQTQVILPSTEFTNARDFLTKLKPPFFEDYQINIIDDSIDSTSCYSYSPLVKIATAILCIFFITFLVLQTYVPKV